MSYKIDFNVATSQQIELSLCEQIGKIRLVRNLTQEQVAVKAGVSLKTIGRLERGQGSSLDTFIRVMIALGLQSNLMSLLPDPDIRPIERVTERGSERQRARPISSSESETPWKWGDEKETEG